MDIIRDIFTDLRAIGQSDIPIQETIHPNEIFEEPENSFRRSNEPEVKTLCISFLNIFYMFINSFTGKYNNTRARR
jgi:hypothetical protein